MIKVRQKGDYKVITEYLIKAKKGIKLSDLGKYGKQGVAALSSNTPVDTGLTASSWYYKIERGTGLISISFYNSNVNNGVLIAVILQTGHGTRNGGWVEGQDYINPALRPIFEKIADDAWKEVSSV